jgi:NAD(P)-dependent dehydrogenase (short-subunit alcohol dehydrogenase family)
LHSPCVADIKSQMKTALVFGAAGSLGRAISAALVAADVRVLGVARDEAKLPGLEAFSADLGSEREVEAACLWAAREAGGVDLLVFAAGRMANGPLAEMSADAMLRLWTDNLLIAHLANRHATPLLNPEAHRIFLGAYVDKLAFAKLGAYAAAKAALDAWARVLIREERNLKTTLLRLPAIDTALWAHAPFPLPKGALAPAAVGEEVLRCWREGKTGVVDLAEGRT